MSLCKIRQQNPLVYCITNTEAANFTANGLLGDRASPLMSDEVAEARALINIAECTAHSVSERFMKRPQKQCSWQERRLMKKAFRLF